MEPERELRPFQLVYAYRCTDCHARHLNYAAGTYDDDGEMIVPPYQHPFGWLLAPCLVCGGDLRQTDYPPTSARQNGFGVGLYVVSGRGV